MKPLAVGVILMGVLLAQTGSQGTIETCGHACHCLRRTFAIQQRAMDDCRKAGGTAEDCLKRQPLHCDLIESTEYEEESDESDPRMTERCVLACKKHDCKCDDGPVCHVGHQARDHAQAPKQKKP